MTEQDEEGFGESDEYDLAAVIQEEERGDTLNEAPGATLRRNLTMMQGGEPSPVGKNFTEFSVFHATVSSNGEQIIGYAKIKNDRCL